MTEVSGDIYEEKILHPHLNAAAIQNLCFLI